MRITLALARGIDCYWRFSGSGSVVQTQIVNIGKKRGGPAMTTLSTVMESGGEFSRQHLIGFAVADRVRPSLISAAQAVQQLRLERFKQPAHVDAGEIFTYCDFGAADGRRACSLARAVVSAVRGLDKDSAQGRHEVQVIMQDQPDNDFAPIFRDFQGTVGQAKDGVYVSAVGRSFYKRCFPLKSLDLAFSCIATEWMDMEWHSCEVSQKSVQLFKSGWNNLFREDLFPSRLQTADGLGQVDFDGQAGCSGELTRVHHKSTFDIEKKAAADWMKFLTLRGKELKHGGRLLTVNICRGTDIDPSPGGEAWKMSRRTVSCLLDVVDEFTDRGLLNEKERSNFLIPSYTRTEAELKAPFLDAASDVRKAGLQLVSCDLVTVACPSKERFLQGRISLSELANELAESIRSWSYNLVRSAMDESRPEKDKNLLCKECFDRLAEVLHSLCEEESLALPYPLAILVAEKQ